MSETPDTTTPEASEPEVVNSLPPDEGVRDRTPDEGAGYPDGQPAPDDEVENPAAAAKGRENSKLRERLRDTSAKLETLQRRQAEHVASQHLADASELWLTGITIADLLTEDGDVDDVKVAEAAKALIADRPHWRKRAPAAPPASSVTSNGKIGGDTRPSFEAAFAPRRG